MNVSSPNLSSSSLKRQLGWAGRRRQIQWQGVPQIKYVPGQEIFPLVCSVPWFWCCARGWRKNPTRPSPLSPSSASVFYASSCKQFVSNPRRAEITGAALSGPRFPPSLVKGKQSHRLLLPDERFLCLNPSGLLRPTRIAGQSTDRLPFESVSVEMLS